MSKAPTDRPIPLGLTMLIALFSALAALAFSGGHGAHAHRGHALQPDRRAVS
jgi:hypothetical protein